MVVKVEQKHIDNGKILRCEQCPVALALREVFDDCPIVVFSEDVMIDDRWYDAPKSMTKFVRDFDNHKQVQPFEFELDLDNPSCGNE